MTGKTRPLYQAVLKKIREIALFKDPNSRIAIQKARCDFEDGLMEALTTTFEDADVIGCWFHYGQVRNVHSWRLF